MVTEEVEWYERQLVEGSNEGVSVVINEEEGGVTERDSSNGELVQVRSSGENTGSSISTKKRVEAMIMENIPIKFHKRHSSEVAAVLECSQIREDLTAKIKVQQEL